ncbi:hypothetical protein F0U61_05400 [Archangium violaceum]|uniref:hypothetical protein n=1 Tax=Archangium violaceum TaxID=83451 RepID=UPI002B29862B|nr:hypothetical protein F0U61_05400 [Archangium violaceum]
MTLHSTITQAGTPRHPGPLLSRPSVRLALAAVISAAAFFSSPARAEESPTRLPLTVAYFGETLVHPGLTVGTELSLVRGDVGAVVLTGNLGGYVHPRNHVGLFASAEMGGRLTAPFGLYGELLVGAGYLHSFLQGPVYEVSRDGSVLPAADAGRPAVMPTASLGLGWDLQRNGVAPLALFTRLTLFGQFPFNQRLLPHAAVQLGVRFQ